MPKNEKSMERPKQVISVSRSVATIAAVALVASTALATVTLSRLATRSAANNPGEVKSSSPSTRTGGVAIQTTEGSAQQAPEDELRIELSASGFSPAEVTHAAGNFALAIENQNITSEYVLQLKGAGGVLLNEVRVQKGSAVWSVDLPAGNYTLMVANHPDWVCQITTQ